MTEEENKDEKTENETKRPDIEIGSGWECSVDTGSC